MDELEIAYGNGNKKLALGVGSHSMEIVISTKRKDHPTYYDFMFMFLTKQQATQLRDWLNEALEGMG